MLRNLVSRIADIHFAPTSRAAANLLAEGLPKDRILTTGNTVVDAMQLAWTLLDEEAVYRELTLCDPAIRAHLQGRKLVLVTSHRRENIGEPLRAICRTVQKLARRHEDALFLWPLHRNPDVRAIVEEETVDPPKNFILGEAFTYQTMLFLLKQAHVVLTDSGGIQEEAATIGKPVIILRECTERPEVVESGYGIVTEADPDRITGSFERLFALDGHAGLARRANPFGDGKASDRIMAFLDREETRSFIARYPASAGDVLHLPAGWDA
jgi:UDP-N-acetylglucosamine 2-epimerase